MTARTAETILALVRARAQRLAAWTEHLWRSGEASPDQGPAIGPGEVARLLAPSPEAEAAFNRKHAAGPAKAAEDASAALGQDSVWREVRRIFALSDEEADFLALLVAVELDPGFARVIAYLHDDGRLTEPTPWLRSHLAGEPPAPPTYPNLLRWLLAQPAEGAPSGRLNTPWLADPAVARAIATDGWEDPAIAIAVRRTEPEAAKSLDCLHPGALAELAKVEPREAELVGPPGIGAETLAAQYAAGRDQPLLAVDLKALSESGGEAPAWTVIRGLRQAAMTGALAYFRAAEAAPPAVWARAEALGVPFLRGVRHPTGLARPVILSPLRIDGRLALWRRTTDAAAPPEIVSQRLTPAEVVALAQRGSPPRRQRPDHALLTLLPTPYDWADLVIPADVESQLKAFESQVRLRWTVYEEWGFSRLTHLGQGISALFGGPSGTGKTMAAQVMARSLDLDLLRVDLAGVVNKYIGETEKRLREVFDACEDSGALLFFDEADALFGNRTQVKDAHDRFANIEIDYLLQRIERFDGVAILATNRRQDLDPAFVRRLRFVVEFLPPRPDERLALWRLALPSHAPSGEEIRGEIDWTYLTDRLTMTGAEIKSTALGAA
ncbi:MAG TPA: AAA family ATPase, partial [Caulobacteraceae bacterium]